MKVQLYICQYEKQPYYMGSFRSFNSLKNLWEYVEAIKEDLKKYNWDRLIILRIKDRQQIMNKQVFIKNLN